MLDGSPFSHSPLSFEDLIDDSYLGAPVKQESEEVAGEEVVLLDEHRPRQLADRSYQSA